MNQQEIASIAKTKFQSIFNTGETIIPFIVAGLFLIFLNVPFIKIRGLMGWSSFMDLKESLFDTLYSISGNSLLDFHGFSDSIMSSISAIFFGLVIGSWLIAAGRYFIHTRLAGLSILWIWAYVYVISKFFIMFDDFLDLGRNAGIWGVLDKISSSMVNTSTPVLLTLIGCLIFLALTALKVSAYVAMRFWYAKINKIEWGYYEVPDVTRKKLSRIASVLSIPLIILSYVLLVSVFRSHWLDATGYNGGQRYDATQKYDTNYSKPSENSWEGL